MLFVFFIFYITAFFVFCLYFFNVTAFFVFCLYFQKRMKIESSLMCVFIMHNAHGKIELEPLQFTDMYIGFRRDGSSKNARRVRRLSKYSLFVKDTDCEVYGSEERRIFGDLLTKMQRMDNPPTDTFSWYQHQQQQNRRKCHYTWQKRNCYPKRLVQEAVFRLNKMNAKTRPWLVGAFWKPWSSELWWMYCSLEYKKPCMYVYAKKKYEQPYHPLGSHSTLAEDGMRPPGCIDFMF